MSFGKFYFVCFAIKILFSYYPKLVIVVRNFATFEPDMFSMFILLFVIKPGIIIDKQYHILYSLFDPQIVCFWPIYHKNFTYGFVMLYL